ncbi:MAG: dUTP diphosphatase [Minwuia sp.]|uniref:dUTP diphosphatase n=1 Tax=Minwuia sp. TaxID=2493630 RepID=UPI003A8B2D34
MSVSVAITRVGHGADLPLPAYETSGAAGMDLRAATGGDIEIEPMARALIPAGIAIALPEGYEAQVRPRSGLAAKHGITVLNSPGTVDSDYRGEVGVILANLSAAPFTVRHGDRIAQLVIAPVSRCNWTEAATLEASERGAGGFGSTGGQS